MNRKRITFMQEFRWRLWEVLDYKFFTPITFHKAICGTWFGILLASFQCYVGILVLPNIKN